MLREIFEETSDFIFILRRLTGFVEPGHKIVDLCKEHTHTHWFVYIERANIDFFIYIACRA